MPWRIEQRKNEFCVITETSGEVMGCHPSRREARAQQAALYAAESKKETQTEVSMTDKATWSGSYVGGLPDASFLYIEPGGEKDEDGRTTPRSLRHFPYKDAGGGVDLPHLRNAISRLGQPATGRGWKTSFSSMKRASLTAKARGILKRQQKSALEKLQELVKGLFDPIPEPEPVNCFMVWKDGKAWNWLAIYSNKFRDQDDPPEILSEAAHKEFVAAVDEGEWEYPELRLWHIPGTEWGETQFVAYDDRGFSIAAGICHDPEVAEKLAQREDVAVSHGMPTAEMQRDDEDPTVIVRYRTSEISALPLEAAANKLTGFYPVDGGNMTMPEEKRKFVEELMGAEKAAELEEALDGKAKEAEDLEFKEEAEEKEEEAPVAESEPDAESEAEPVYVTEEEVAEAVGQTVGPLIEQVAALAESVQGIASQFKEVTDAMGQLQKDDEQKIQEALELTPGASLAHRIQSVIGREETKVDGRTSFAKSAPKEAPVNEGPTMIPFINQHLEAQRGGYNG